MISEIKVKSSFTGYEGQIKLSILKGKKLIKSKIIHNTGTWRLFETMAFSIAGNYDNAESFRPKYIRLYNGQPAAADVDYSWFDSEMYSRLGDQEADSSRSDYLIYSSTPLVEYYEHDKDNNESISADNAAVTFKFIIPYVKIFGEDANLFVLYSSPTNGADNPCAYFALTKEDNKGEPIWGALSDLTANLKEYNVSIEWKMTIQNKMKGE